MTQQQTERDDALIAEARKNIEKICPALKDDTRTIAAEALRLARENWTPTAKPDRYVVAAREMWEATWKGNNKEEREFEQAAVLRKHFPSVEVPQEVGKLVDVALASKSQYGIHSSEEVLARFIKDFILKGDQ